EDRQDADIDDGDAEQGFFSPWSWWPFMLGLSLALMFLGFAVGVWISIIGAPLVLVAVVGWQFEYYRGNFAR
ncbi:MAG: cytochrome c oxidase subunit 4, partial [Gordonia polyisoprenivorans]|nr:cytochrome c oxidase subunit 4 [Gordonia polyisoprenivorans]